ncbi:hypothetical protein GCM10027053_20220 [Intrasporangium mesophilum]
MAFTTRTRRRLLLWGCACVVLCVALCLTAVVSPATLDRWDQILQIGPSWWHDAAPWLERPLVWISYAFGTAASLVATAVVAALLARRNHRREAVYLVVVIAGTSLITTGLKLVVDLPRPVVEDPILQYTTSAMPSGHASNIAAATTAAGVLSALLLDKRAHRLVLGVGIVAALAVGLDRLMLGVHTLTEVMAGYALGVGVGLLTAYVLFGHGSSLGIAQHQHGAERLE